MLRTLALAMLVSLVLCSLGPARAWAHPGLDDARARYESGDFAGALSALDRAEGEGPLTLDELVALQELRVLLHRAHGDEAASDRALRILAALRPDHTLGGEIPPVVRERFQVFARASSGPPRVELDVAPREGGVTITARVEGDDESLAQGTSVRARVAGGPWIEGERAVEVSAPEGARIEYEGSARGPAGAALAETRGEHTMPTAERGDDAWPWVALGGGVLVVGAVVVAVVVALSGVDTRVDGPVVAELRF